jgi:hypothetical protein
MFTNQLYVFPPYNWLLCHCRQCGMALIHHPHSLLFEVRKKVIISRLLCQTKLPALSLLLSRAAIWFCNVLPTLCFYLKFCNLLVCSLPGPFPHVAAAMMIFGFLFFLLKHNSRLDLPNGWHPASQAHWQQACRSSTYTAHGVWTQDLYWVPGSQNGLYQWAITPRQWSLFWVYMCMTEVLGHRRSYPLHPLAPIHQFSAWHMCLQWNCRLWWPSQPIIRFWKLPPSTRPPHTT